MKDQRTYLKAGLFVAIVMMLAMAAPGASAQDIDETALAVARLTGTTNCSPLTDTCDHAYSGHHTTTVPTVGGEGQLLNSKVETDYCQWPDHAEIFWCNTHLTWDDAPINECTSWAAKTYLPGIDSAQDSRNTPASAC